MLGPCDTGGVTAGKGEEEGTVLRRVDFDPVGEGTVWEVFAGLWLADGEVWVRLVWARKRQERGESLPDGTRSSGRFRGLTVFPVTNSPYCLTVSPISEAARMVEGRWLQGIPSTS